MKKPIEASTTVLVKLRWALAEIDVENWFVAVHIYVKIIKAKNNLYTKPK